MPHDLRFMHVLLYGALAIAVVAILLFVIAGTGKRKR
jgi:hypothetical protein